MSAWRSRTEIVDQTLPNLIDERPNIYRPESGEVTGPLFFYWHNAQGQVLVSTRFAGLVPGFSAQGRKYPSLAAAAADVRVARVLVADRFAARNWPTTYVN